MPITVKTAHKMKQQGEKITMLTAYDASFAQLMDKAGVDMILVGDSLGMVVQGHDSTVPVSMDDMVYHTRAVRAGVESALVIADMPFLAYYSADQALRNGGRLMKEGGANMVKLEGGAPQLDTVHRLTSQGVPVCAHIGLQPQSVNKLGGYFVQGRDPDSAAQMLQDAIDLQQAGADLLLLECVTSDLAQRITDALSIPTIGIGAGVDVDGQVLVMHDLLGVTNKPPSFARNFLHSTGSVQAAIEAYIRAVKEQQFPNADEQFSQ